MMKLGRFQKIGVLSFFILALFFFAGYKFVVWHEESREIVNLLGSNDLSAAVSLIKKDYSAAEKFYHWPWIGKDLELRARVQDLESNMRQVEDGTLWVAMLAGKKNALSVLQNVREDWNWLEDYGVKVSAERKNDLDNWLSFLGEKTPRHYLILFQDADIPRATGGLIGAYAILSFDQGALDLSGDNIFALEEVFLNNIVPPDPLRTVSDKWLFHDANWFFDYPASGQKILDFYAATGSQPDLDGVIIVNLTAVENMLEKISPIEINGFGRRIDQGNFSSFFKNEVQTMAKPALERGEDNLLPAFFQAWHAAWQNSSAEKLASLPSVLSEGLDSKAIQIYVRDDKLEYFFDALGWTGRVEEGDYDYLGIVGNLFTDNFIEDKREKTVQLQTTIGADGEITNVLTIGAASAGTADVSQETYLKIYLPKGITVQQADNGYLKKNKDISSYYQNLGYSEDEDLARAERTMVRNENWGLDIYEEGGKTVVACWAQLSRRPFRLVYKLPAVGADIAFWGLKAQKQSGLPALFSYTLLWPEGKTTAPTLFPFGELIPWSGDLNLNFKAAVANQ